MAAELSRGQIEEWRSHLSRLYAGEFSNLAQIESLCDLALRGLSDRAETIEECARVCESDYVRLCMEDEVHDNEIGKDGDGTSFNQGVDACIKAIRALAPGGTK